MNELIRLSSVAKSVIMGDTVVPDRRGVELTVAQGEYVAILGPSGSGKSTLMNVLGCMDSVQQGEYHLAGLPIHLMDDFELTAVRNQLIGFIFQRYHLIPTYNVLQNVMMPLLVRGESRETSALAALEQLNRLGIISRIHHKPNELSGGQQQRVAIARALVTHPKLLLADEPTGALDFTTAQEVMKLFSSLNEMVHTVVMITHDRQISMHAKRTLFIVDGKFYENADHIPEDTKLRSTLRSLHA